MWCVRVVMGILLTLAGCAASPGPAPDAESSAPPFVLPAGQAALYVVRRAPGGPAVVPIVVDGHPVGTLVMQTYLVLPVAPGPHTITAGTSDPQARLSLTTHAGKHYFIGVMPRSGASGTRVELAEMDETAGTIAVLATSRVQGVGSP